MRLPPEQNRRHPIGFTAPACRCTAPGANRVGLTGPSSLTPAGVARQSMRTRVAYLLAPCCSARNRCRSASVRCSGPGLVSVMTALTRPGVWAIDSDAT
jgi:hypothetical protein